jgi:hypothetical protein
VEKIKLIKKNKKQIKKKKFPSISIIQMKKQKKVTLKSFCCCTTSVSGHYCGITSSSIKLNPPIIKTTTTTTAAAIPPSNAKQKNTNKPKRKLRVTKNNACPILSSAYDDIDSIESSVNMKTVQQNVEYFSNFNHSTPIGTTAASQNNNSSNTNTGNNTLSYSTTAATISTTNTNNSIHFYHPKSIQSNNLTSITPSSLESACHTTRSSLTLSNNNNSSNSKNNSESLIRSTATAATLELVQNRFRGGGGARVVGGPTYQQQQQTPPSLPPTQPPSLVLKHYDTRTLKATIDRPHPHVLLNSKKLLPTLTHTTTTTIINPVDIYESISSSNNNNNNNCLDSKYLAMSKPTLDNLNEIDTKSEESLNVTQSQSSSCTSTSTSSSKSSTSEKEEEEEVQEELACETEYNTVSNANNETECVDAAAAAAAAAADDDDGEEEAVPNVPETYNNNISGQEIAYVSMQHVIRDEQAETEIKTKLNIDNGKKFDQEILEFNLMSAEATPPCARKTVLGLNAKIEAGDDEPGDDLICDESVKVDVQSKITDLTGEHLANARQRNVLRKRVKHSKSMGITNVFSLRQDSSLNLENNKTHMFKKNVIKTRCGHQHNIDSSEIQTDLKNNMRSCNRYKREIRGKTFLSQKLGYSGHTHNPPPLPPKKNT